jgi:hypothetical protein
MKARRLDDGGLSVLLDQREWRIFSALLAQYASGLDRPPPPSHSSEDPVIEESNTWLREMQATHRQNLVRRAATWLEAGSTPSQEDASQKMLRLSGHDVEWMLQVFNDLRVSHWMLLGCPNEADLKDKKWTEAQLPSVWSMGLCGMFQSVLLQALHGSGKPDDLSGDELTP